MIHLENVAKAYRQGTSAVHALAGASLDVAKGEFLSLMGASGSGKSTMLHLIGGLDVPDSGSIRVGGQELSRLSDDALTIFRRRHIGFVFQFFNLLPTLTAEENVALPLLLDGKSMREVRPRVAIPLRVAIIAVYFPQNDRAVSGMHVDDLNAPRLRGTSRQGQELTGRRPVQM